MDSKKLMEIIAEKPRITLTEISKVHKTSISRVFDMLKDIEVQYELKGKWIKRN